jgi:hypothetical protein
MNVLVLGKMSDKDINDLKLEGCSVTVEFDVVSGLNRLKKNKYDVVAINREQDEWLSLREIIHNVEKLNVKYTIF